MNEKIEIKCISQKNCSKIEICALVTISEMVYSHISPFFWTQCIFSAKQYQSSSLQRNASKRQLEKPKAVTNHIAESVCLLRRLSSAVSWPRRAHFPALNRPPTTRYLTTDAIGTLCRYWASNFPELISPARLSYSSPLPSAYCWRFVVQTDFKKLVPQLNASFLSVARITVYPLSGQFCHLKSVIYTILL